MPLLRSKNQRRPFKRTGSIINICRMYAGQDPVRAMRDIHRLRLFPVVFSVPEPVTGQLGEGYGAPCTQVMADAAALLDAWQVEVHHNSRMHSCKKRNRPALLSAYYLWVNTDCEGHEVMDFAGPHNAKMQLRQVCRWGFAHMRMQILCCLIRSHSPPRSGGQRCWPRCCCRCGWPCSMPAQRSRQSWRPTLSCTPSNGRSGTRRRWFSCTRRRQSCSAYIRLWGYVPFFGTQTWWGDPNGKAHGAGLISLQDGLKGRAVNVQSQPGGENTDEALRVRLGKLLRELGKAGLVRPGMFASNSVSSAHRTDEVDTTHPSCGYILQGYCRQQM